MNCDKILSKLLGTKTKPLGSSSDLDFSEAFFLCQTVHNIFLCQPIVLELRPPLIICGDIHGQFQELLRIFEKCGYPPHKNYLFLGDYVDRGYNSVEVISLLFAFKIKYPENFFLLRGNHECHYINRTAGFYDECIRKYNSQIWRMFNEVFDVMPFVSVVGDRIFCVHGGISPDLVGIENVFEITRPTEIPKKGLITDLLWSDPDVCADWYEENFRGTSWVFGKNPLNIFLKNNNFELLVRAHQVVSDGFDFPFGDDGHVVTLFSAANYCYEHENKGAMMEVDTNLCCSFSVLDPLSYDETYPSLKSDASSISHTSHLLHSISLLSVFE